MKSLLFALVIPITVFSSELFTKSDGAYSVQASIDADKHALNEDFTLTLKLHYPANDVPMLSDLKKNILTPNTQGVFPFYLKTGPAIKKRSGDQIEESATWQLKPAYSGSLSVPLDALRFSSGQKVALETIHLNVLDSTSSIETPPLAPLLPLIPGDPLELRADLRAKLYNQDQSKQNVAYFKSRSFPLFRIIAVLLILFALPFLLRAWRLAQVVPPTEPRKPSLEELSIALAELKNRPQSEAKETIHTLAHVFKQSIEQLAGLPATRLTGAEIFERLKSAGAVAEGDYHFLEVFSHELEKLQFQPEKPSPKAIGDAFENSTEFLHLLKNNRNRSNTSRPRRAF